VSWAKFGCAEKASGVARGDGNMVFSTAFLMEYEGAKVFCFTGYEVSGENVGAGYRE